MANNTFLGLQPYTEKDAYRFKGRTEESQELFRLIVRNDFTVCYAESGEGKTSLLNAGVFPLLRQNMYFPIVITFTSDDYKRTPDSFNTIIDRCIRDSITEYNEKNQGINVEYQLSSTDFQDLNNQANLQQALSQYSWWKLRNYKPQAMGLSFTPVFIFDQFEEVFNLPGSIVWTKKFFDWLEEVSSDSCPDDIIKKVRSIIGDKAAFPAIKEEKDFKAVFSLRKEFIGELDYWGMQKCFIPSLKDNRYCLKALTYKGAKKVMTQQQRFEENKVEQVLHYFVLQYSREPEKTIEENLSVIPALLLSVVCDSWEKDIDFFSGKDENEIGQSLNKILERFYEEALSYITNEISQQKGNGQEDSIRANIETAIFALVDSNGKRVRRKSSELYQLDFDAKYKEILSDKRIIKISKVDGEDYVEVVHDALCPIIAKRKELYLAAEAKKREEEKLREQAKKNRKRMIVSTAIGLSIIGTLLVILWQNNRFLREQEARNLSEAEKDSIYKLNNSLTKQIRINEIQKNTLNKQLQVNEDQNVSLNHQLRIIEEQRIALSQSLNEQKMLSQTLSEKKNELENKIALIEQQKNTIHNQQRYIQDLTNDIKIYGSATNLILREGKIDEGIKEITELIERRKVEENYSLDRLASYYGCRALAWSKLNEYQKAVDDNKKAVSLLTIAGEDGKKDLPFAWYRLAVSYYHLGNPIETMEAADQCIKITIDYYGSLHSETLDAYSLRSNLAGLYNDKKTALQDRQKCLKIIKENIKNLTGTKRDSYWEKYQSETTCMYAYAHKLSEWESDFTDDLFNQQMLSKGLLDNKYLNVGAADVLANLKSNDIAVEFVDYRVGKDSTMCGALVISPQLKHVRFIPLIEVREIKQQSNNLGVKIWKPILDVLFNNIKNIYYSPSESLSQLSIESYSLADGTVVEKKYHIYKLMSIGWLAFQRR